MIGAEHSKEPQEASKHAERWHFPGTFPIYHIKVLPRVRANVCMDQNSLLMETQG